MNIDLRTLAIAVAIIELLQVITVYLLYRVDENAGGLKWWLFGSGLMAVGFMAMPLRDIHSISQLSVIISQSFIVMGMFSYYIGTSRFLNLTVDRRPILLFIVIFMVIISSLTYLDDDISLRTSVQAVMTTFVSFLIGFILIKKRPRSIASSANMLALVFISQALFFGFRAAYVLLVPVSGIFEETLAQSALFVFMLISSFLMTFGFIMMINQRLTAEVFEAKDRFETIFNIGPDMAFIRRMDNGELLQINQRFSDFTGFATEEFIGTTGDRMWKDPDDRVHVLEMMRANGHLDDFEGQFLKKDGSVFTGLASARLFSMGDADLILSVLRDITERKQAEELIQESERKYRLVVNSASEAILVAQDGMLKLVNPVTMAWTGKSEEELKSKPFASLIHPEDRDMVMENHKNRLSGKAIPEHYAFRLMNKDGGTRWVDVGGITLSWEGRPASLTFLTDITERKQAEEALREASRKLQLLSSVTRHDINNQLMVLNGRLALIEGKYDDPVLIDGLRKARTAAEKISVMIQFTKEYEEIGVLAPSWFDLRSLVQEASRDLQSDRVVMVNDVPKNMEVFADPLISKVFHNLVHNAVRHGGDLTKIRFSVEEEGGLNAIVCEDDGVGISDEVRSKLFTRGFGKDHGLGLFLSREILNITGISMTEEGKPGSGARFVLVPPNTGLRKGDAGS